MFVNFSNFCILSSFIVGCNYNDINIVGFSNGAGPASNIQKKKDGLLINIDFWCFVWILFANEIQEALTHKLCLIKNN